MYIVVGVLISAIIICLYMLFNTIYDEKTNKKLIEQRLHNLENENITVELLESIQQANQPAKQSWIEKRKARIKESQLPMTFETYLLFLSASVVGTFVFLKFMCGSAAMAVIGSIAGLLLPEIVINIAVSKAKVAFEEDFTKALKNMAAVIKSGGNYMDAVKNVVNTHSLSERIRKDFKEILIDCQFGNSLEDGFFKLFHRTKNYYVLNVAIVIQVMSKSGGNPAKVFEIISNTISDKQILETKNKALMADAKLSGNLIAFMPFGMMTIIKILKPDYYATFQATFLGKIVTAVCFVMIIIGIYLTNKMTNINVEE